MSIEDWWTRVSGSVLNPSSVVALFAGESAVSTLRQSCFRKKTAWIDIGIHPGQLALAAHILQTIPTPWSGSASQDKALLLGIDPKTINAKDLINGAPRHVSSYMASVLYDKLLGETRDASTKTITREDPGGTTTNIVYLRLGDHKNDEETPNLILNDWVLPFFQSISSLVNVFCPFIISLLHIVSRLLISLCISIVSYVGPKATQARDVPDSLLSFEVKTHSSIELVISGSYAAMNKFALGEDVIKVFGDTLESTASKLERLWKRFAITDWVFALSILTTSLASISFLLLFQHTTDVYQICSLASMLFGWFADNRLKLKNEDDHISIGNMPPGSQIIKVRAQSRALAVAAVYLLEEDQGSAEGFLNLLPNDFVWTEWKRVLRSVPGQKEVSNADDKSSVPMDIKFRSDIVAALEYRALLLSSKRDGLIVEESILSEF
ncbi:hypothetical protein BDR26DRAFT_862612 [Obelidium mucronatum]|nr:hypothetical protein BDR26DRAFT_862612 [Obelidium mucronatum]